VALTAALAHPELVRTLVLGEPPILSLLEVTSVGRSVRDAFVAHALDPARAAFERDRPEEAIGAFLDGISAVPWFGQLPAEQRRGFLRFAPEFRLEMLSARSAYLPPIPCESLSTLQRPVLLLTGEQSPSVFQLVTAELERCLEGESHQAIPGVGHGMHQNAERYNRAVLTFLRSR
jgi:pimeloyl-ACP methyl ester carboxylesterase